MATSPVCWLRALRHFTLVHVAKRAIALTVVASQLHRSTCSRRARRLPLVNLRQRQLMIASPRSSGRGQRRRDARNGRDGRVSKPTGASTNYASSCRIGPARPAVWTPSTWRPSLTPRGAARCHVLAARPTLGDERAECAAARVTEQMLARVLASLVSWTKRSSPGGGLARPGRDDSFRPKRP